jgi:transposase
MEKILYVGMDVHKDCAVIAILGTDGKLVMETVIENKSETLRQFIRGLDGRVYLTLEEGTHAAWLYDLLRPHVAQLLVCDPRQNKLLGSGSKSDRIDAKKLAQLLRAGLLKPVYHGECGTRPLKELGGSYEALVEDTTRVMNRIKALFRARGLKCEGAEVYRADRREQWLAKLADGGARARAGYLYRELEHLLELRGESRQQMLVESQRHAAHGLLKQVPELGPIRIAQIIATVDTPHRFRTKRQFWAYVGLAVVTRSSADYRMVGGSPQRAVRATQTRGVNMNYNRRLKEVFKSAATSACARGPYRPYFERLVASGMRREMARLTVARKLAATVLSVWKRGAAFDASRMTTAAAS